MVSLFSSAVFGLKLAKQEPNCFGKMALCDIDALSEPEPQMKNPSVIVKTHM